MRTIEDPVIEKNDSSFGGTISKHPAYGQIGVSRISSSNSEYLYGSDFGHQHFMTITIRRSELHRGLSRDWQHGREELIQVAMSEAQWATFVSSPNMGNGVPCTLQHIGCKPMPGLPIPEDLSGKFGKEMLETMKDLQQDLDRMIEGVSGLGLGKAKSVELTRNLSMIRDRLVGNTTFVADQFSEHVETVVEQAKVEVDAYATSQIMRAGLQSLGAPISLLRNDGVATALPLAASE